MNQSANTAAIPLDQSFRRTPKDPLASLTREDLDAYFAASLPTNQPNFRGDVPERERKHFLVINPVHLIDRDTAFGEAAWLDMVSHHLFPGHSSCNMVFEQFYHSEMLNLDEYLDYYAEDNHRVPPFVLLILSWLHRNGYHYVGQETLNSDGGEIFDGVLLDICW